jgi:8-oxo-dGTP diphosphatase
LSNPKIYTSIAIQSGGGFLVTNHIHRPGAPWRFPGGKPEPGESLLVSAARELYEELGIIARSLIFHSEHTHKADGAVWTGHVFECPDFIGIPRIMEPAKHGEIKYMTWQELEAAKSHPEAEVARALWERAPF